MSNKINLEWQDQLQIYVQVLSVNEFIIDLNEKSISDKINYEFLL